MRARFRILRRLAAGALLLSNGGALAQSAPASATARQIDHAVAAAKHDETGTSHRACQLGLISVVGDRFNMTLTGPLNFQATEVHDRADWNLDDLVVARVRAATPGLDVRHIPYDKDELRGTKPNRIRPSGVAAATQDFARVTAAGTSCQRYILIHRDTRWIEGSNASVGGFGVALVRNILQKDKAYLYALTYIRIYDGQTFDLIGEAAATAGPEPSPVDFRSAKYIGGPVREIDIASFPATPRQGATNPIFRDTIRSLLVTSLDRTLPKVLRAARKPPRD